MEVVVGGLGQLVALEQRRVLGRVLPLRVVEDGPLLIAVAREPGGAGRHDEKVRPAGLQIAEVIPGGDCELGGQPCGGERQALPSCDGDRPAAAPRQQTKHQREGGAGGCAQIDMQRPTFG